MTSASGKRSARAGVRHLGGRHVLGAQPHATALHLEAALRVRRRALAELDLLPAALPQAVLLEAGEQAVRELLVGLAEERILEAEAPRDQAEHLGVRLRLPARLDRGLVPGQVVMAPGEDHVEVLELRGRGEHHVGVCGGVGHELLEHDREQVLAPQAGEHALLIGRDRGGVRAPADERLHRGLELRVGEGVAELGHVEAPDGARPQLLTLELQIRDHPRRGRRDVGAAAAAIAPRAGQGGQRGERRIRGGRAGVALGAHAQPQQRGPRARELARDALDRLAGDPADLGRSLDAPVLEGRQQLVIALGVSAAPLLVLEARVHDRAHHAEAERGVGPGQRAQVLVGHARGAAPERVHHHEPRAVLAGVEQLAPEMRRRRHRVPAPDEHVAGERPLLGVDLGREAVRHDGSDDPGGRADRALELRRAERVHHARAHRVALDQPLRAHVRVRQDRLAAVLVPRAPQTRGHELERLVPVRAPELARSPWRQCARVDAAGAPPSRRARGSSRPCRRGSRP